MNDPTTNIAAMVNRLRAVGRRLTPDELGYGRSWYPKAGRIAADLHANPAAGAAIIAALSPRQHWHVNTRIAREIAADPHGAPRRTLGAPDALARQIALSGDPEPLTGPKRRAFAAAIAGDPTAVTVDVWAARAAGVPDGVKITPERYARIARAYQLACDSTDLSPRDFQAAVWVHTRGRSE